MLMAVGKQVLPKNKCETEYVLTCCAVRRMSLLWTCSYRTRTFLNLWSGANQRNGYTENPPNCMDGIRQFNCTCLIVSRFVVPYKIQSSQCNFLIVISWSSTVVIHSCITRTHSLSAEARWGRTRDSTLPWRVKPTEEFSYTPVDNNLLRWKCSNLHSSSGKTQLT